MNQFTNNFDFTGNTRPLAARILTNSLARALIRVGILKEASLSG